jgi:hypothetical protein
LKGPSEEDGFAAGTARAPEILVVFADALDSTLTNEIAKLHHHGIGNAVIDGVAIAAAADDAGVVEQLQVPGDVGLIAIELEGEVADSALAGFERLQEPQAEGLAEEAKAAGDEVNHFVALAERAGHGLTI